MAVETTSAADQASAENQGATPARQAGRKRYHHGDLREALIAATTQLVIEKGAENFSLADACRLAGVSTAAPYKHFSDREEILKEVCTRAFDRLAERGIAAAKAAGETTMAGVIAMNLAYVDMAVEQPALFRLMFGQNPSVKEDEAVLGCGRTCFEAVLGQMRVYCDANNVAEDALTIFMRTWAFIHGVASLQIDGDYEAVTPGFDYRALVASTIPQLVGAPTIK
jgi:AcrR family transcriptional regulator